MLPNPNFAQIVIVTKDLAARERVKARLERALAAGALPEARTRVDRFNFGPPVGFPVQFRIVGPDPMQVRGIAEQVRAVMAQNPKVIDPHLNWGEQVKSIRLEVDQDRARALGLTPQDVSQTLQTLLSGYTVTQLREGIESIDVVARAVPAERLALDRLGDLTIATTNGVAVLAHPQVRAAALRIRGADPVAAQPRHCADRAWRHRRQRAGARRHQRDPAEAAIHQGRAPLRLPHRDRRLDRGKRQGQQRACRRLPGQRCRMLALLMIQLQSFSRLALVFVTAPLGLIGATGALLLSGRPFGFVALLGLIALAGMIMRNTVILVDQIDRDITAGRGRYRAVVDATVRRARPVALTALAAILGMIPLAGSLFWGPMAITIMGGLFVATVLTLLVVPALYALWFRVKADEPADAAHPELAHEPDWEEAPFGIAAE